jgi:hypothetical protein
VPPTPDSANAGTRAEQRVEHVVRRLAAALRSRWALPALVVTAFALSLWVQHMVYPDLSWNRDEPVYLWHAEVLQGGKLSAPHGGYPEVLQPWLSAVRGNQVFSQYTLGWPLVVLLGLLLGSAGLAVAAGAALTVGGTWALAHELSRDRLVAGAAAGLMLASPILAVQGGVYLNYLFTLGLGLLFLTAIFSGVRRASPVRLLAAGVLLGWIALTRPFDAVVWGAVAGGYLALLHWRSWRRHVG